MDDVSLEEITVGSGSEARRIAVRHRSGAEPGLFWLPGYAADMAGDKATAIDRFAAARGEACTRFDPSGNGLSGGDFLDGTISRWLEEAAAVFERFTSGRQIVLGSSMGGWIALRLADRLFRQGNSRIAGLILIAPATDMTEALMWARMSRKVRAEIERTGRWTDPKGEGRNQDVITWKLIEDGRQHLFGDRPIEVGCPVHILQGLNDASVPWQSASELVTRLASDDVVLTLVKDGDHRLSRTEDLERMTATIERMIAEIGQS